MSDHHINMFSIPLFHYQIKNWERKKEDLLKIYSKASENIKSYTEDTVMSDYFRSGETNVSYWEEIEEVIGEELYLFSEYTGRTYKQNGHWFERSLPGMHHEVHNHGSLGYSAICYIEYDEYYHTPTKFISPFNNFYVGSQLIHIPEEIKSGSLLFFPSVIHHYTSPNISNKERIILSFNLLPTN